MCLVLFSWLTNQQFFLELSTSNIKEKMYRQQMEQIENDMLPSPMIYDETIMDGYVENGAFWKVVER
jgi:hypothetical protein